MAISAYTGLPGSGKSYEVVRYVIAPAIASGRRVISNIAELNLDEIHAYCVEHLDGKPGSMGEVVQVEDADIERSDFFPTEEAEGQVRPGDLVVIDEAWRWWGTGNTFRPEHLAFFRKHRHYVHPESGVSCDIVVISQDIGDFHRNLKSVVELSTRTKKLKTLGLDNAYVVSVWEGPNQRKKPISTNRRTYRKDVFPLYKSYSMGDAPGKELVVDKRQNMLRSPAYLIGGPVMLIVFVLSVWQVVTFFNPDVPAKASAAVGSDSAQIGETISAKVSQAHTTGTSSGDVSKVAVRTTPPLSTTWRLSGFVEIGDRREVLIIDPRGRIRYVSPGSFSFQNGRPVAGVVDGERVTEWTGSLPGMGDAISSILPTRVGGLTNAP